MEANKFNTKGNTAFRAKSYEEAISFFTQGIAVDASNHVLHSNRSACYAAQEVMIV